VGVEPIEVSGVGAGVTTSTTVGAKLSTPDPNGELPYVGSNVSIAAGTRGGVVVGDGGVCGIDRVVGIAYIDVITVLVTIDQF
jgi:hypothetical protein